MSPNIEYQQRHWDYVMGPNQTGGSGGTGGAFGAVAANAVLQGIPLTLDLDAPFILRSIAARVQYDTTSSAHRQTNLNQIQLRFTGPAKNYFHQSVVPLNLIMPYGGQIGCPSPLQRQVWYPPQSTIYVDVTNNGANTLTNLTLYFRGVKLFPKGQRPAWTYPAKIQTTPYTYNATVSSLAVQGPPVRSIFTATGGWDFVFRSIQANRTFTNLTWEVFIKLYDSDLYPYSSDFMHLDVLAGNATGPATFPTGTSFIAPVGTGPAVPGLWFPEIYLPTNANLVYDVFRLDNVFVAQGAIAQDLPIQFTGAKIFRQAA